MSKRTKAFMLYTNNSADEMPSGLPIYAPNTCDPAVNATCSIDWSGFQLGVMHNF